MQLDRFQITNYRNVLDSGWIRVSDITALVGPNESGKSNVFEALYRIKPVNPKDGYDINEDWPVDDWANKKDGVNKTVAHAIFNLGPDDIQAAFNTAKLPTPAPAAEGEVAASPPPQVVLPEALELQAWRSYAGATQLALIKADDFMALLDKVKFAKWAQENLPTFVLISDYEFTANYVELPNLANRLAERGWKNLTDEDQTILIILELASIDIADFVQKGESPGGRTQRSYDKREASKYLSDQFSKLWRQKKVKFEIEIDGPTLNIMVTDEGMDMPVRLHRRSTGFRWHVSFAWRFTHASKGEYEDCILLLEEPGVHLHPDGQRDLLAVFERLATTNTILYTTHLASLIDPAYPERVRIAEVKDHHAHVIDGIVSGQRGPMAVIEHRLGLTGDQSSLLGNRQTLVVEGGDDLVILGKLNGLLAADSKGLSPRVYMWPAEGAPKTPMYAGMIVGHGWDGGVLLDSDEAGAAAAKKIKELYLKDAAKQKGTTFRVFDIAKAAGLKGNEAAVEDLFPPEFYLECVNSAYRIAIKPEDLPVDGSSMITKRVEKVLKQHHGQSELDKRRVFIEMLKRFDNWKTSKDLPNGTAKYAEKLFANINKTFAPELPPTN
ncbi:MAG TPA: AAA family ATPase [Rhizomicrobium sp.]|jgi:energy-coupling factor transporter ATP-binding protein EcfA2|nr:AAA family ATPase [Rhizomicrobium sp.]